MPPSVVTGIIDPVLTGIYGPIEGNINQTLGVLSAVRSHGWTGRTAGFALGRRQRSADDRPPAATISALASSPATAPWSAPPTSATPRPTASPSTSGRHRHRWQSNHRPWRYRRASGRGRDRFDRDRQPRLYRCRGAGKWIAIGTDAAVGAGGIGSVALGSGANASTANAVALGAGSVADRANSVSIGAVGSERQLTTSQLTALTDAVNLGQLNAVAALIPTDAVQYDDASHTVVTFDGVGGTRLTNVQAGAVTAASTDAVNGSQLFGVQTQVTNNTTAISNLVTQVGGSPSPRDQQPTAITNLETQVGGNTTAITNLSIAISNGAIGPVQYSNLGTPTSPLAAPRPTMSPWSVPRPDRSACTTSPMA